MSKAKSKAKTKAKPKSASAADMDWPSCQLMLVVEPGPGAVDRLRAACDSVAPAAVLIRPAPGQNLGAGECKSLVDCAQQMGSAAIIVDDFKLARTLKADGVHFSAGNASAVSVMIGDARAALGVAANIGIDAGISRHRAMEAGEAGADYVAFGATEGTELAREARGEMIAWWAEIFEVPCVALDIATADEAARADRDGADFVALTVPAAASVDDVMTLVGDVDGVLMAGSQAAGSRAAASNAGD